MKIVWSPEAVEDLVSLRAYIAEDSPATAQRTVRLIIESIEQLLPDNPRMGRAGRVPGTRELVIPRTPYIVPYRLQRTTIQILRVYHAARNYSALTVFGSERTENCSPLGFSLAELPLCFLER